MSSSARLRCFILVIIELLVVYGRVYFESVVVLQYLAIHSLYVCLPTLLGLLGLLLSWFVLFFGLNHILVFLVESILCKYACPWLVETWDIVSFFFLLATSLNISFRELHIKWDTVSAFHCLIWINLIVANRLSWLLQFFSCKRQRFLFPMWHPFLIFLNVKR